MKKLIQLALPLLLAIPLTGAEAPLRTLSTTGTAEVKVSPDICYMSFTVETRNISASKAYNNNNKLMNKINASIKNLSIPAKNMQSVNFSISPEYHWDKQNKKIFDGYLVSHILTVKVYNLDKVSDILDAAVKAGATRVNNVNFTVENPKKYLAKARIEAIRVCRKKAEAMAKEAGVKLAKPITISETPLQNNYQSYAQTNIRLDASYAEAAPVTALEAGEISLSYTVYIVYEIQ